MRKPRVTYAEIEERLYQTSTWRSADGALHRIELMEPRYAHNIIGWLEQRASSLKTLADLAYAIGPEPIGEMAQEAVEHEQLEQLEEGDLEWLQQTPLYRALKDRARGDQDTPQTHEHREAA